jgi:ribosome-binding protein aMBF1 (putative translation factor)
MAKAQRKADSPRTLSPLPPVSAHCAAPTQPLIAAPDAPPSLSRPHTTPSWHATASRKSDQEPGVVRRFGEILRAARLYRDIAQDELAFRAHFHRSHVSLIECGRRDIRLVTICALAAALRLNPADLMPTNLAGITLAPPRTIEVAGGPNQ